MNRKFLNILVWFLVPLLLWWALRQVSFKEVGAALSHLTLVQIVSLVGLNLLIFLLISGRWWLITRRQGYHLPFAKMVLYRLAAFGFSYYTPGPQLGGLPLQVHLLHKHNAVPAAAAVAGVTLDKLIDLSINFPIAFCRHYSQPPIIIFPDFGISSSFCFLPTFLFPCALILLACGSNPILAETTVKLSARAQCRSG
jgi:hypothetical protein